MVYFELRNESCRARYVLVGPIIVVGHYLVVWDADGSVSVISGKIMVTPSETDDRTVGGGHVLSEDVTQWSTPFCKDSWMW